MTALPFSVELSTRAERAFESKAQHVFQTFMDTLGAPLYLRADNREKKPGEVIRVLYAADRGQEDDCDIFIRMSDRAESFFRQRTSYDISEMGLHSWNGRQVPLLFHDTKAQPKDVREDLLHHGKPIGLDLDIIASAFFWLSLWQEWGCPQKDRYGRFPYGSGLQARAGILPSAYVNDYLNIFVDLMNAFLKGRCQYSLSLNPWPEGKRFAVALSHDIDWVEMDLRVPEGSSGREKGLTIDCWNFDEIVGLEKEYGCSSSFYFMAGGSERDDWCGRRYDIKQDRFKRLFGWLRDQGSEIGLHGSFKTYKDPLLLEAQKKALEAAAGCQISGGRQHFLLFSQPETFLALQKAGMRYDNTLGYAEIEGFRSAFAFPYHPYDPAGDRPLTILSIPLNIMDATLWAYRGLKADQAWQAIESVLSAGRDAGGCIGVLWHNIYLDRRNESGYSGLYKRILEWISLNNGWAVSCKELQEYWGNRRGHSPRLGSIVTRPSHLVRSENREERPAMKVEGPVPEEDLKTTVYKAMEDFENNRLEAAIPAMQRAIDMGCTDPVVFNNLGVFYYYRGLWERSEDYLKRSSRLDDSYKAPLVNLCRLYNRTGRGADLGSAEVRLRSIAPDMDWRGFQINKDKDQHLAARPPDQVIKKWHTRTVPGDHTKGHESIDTERNRRIRLAFLARPGLDSFLESILAHFSRSYDVRKMIVTNTGQISEAFEWADILWFEWCDELVVYASNLEESREKKVICRLHSYEAFTPFIRRVNWERIDHTIFVAPHIRDIVLKQAGRLDIKDTSLVGNAVDLDRFVFSKREPGYNLAYVGHINYKKGPMLLLHAFRALLDTDNRYRLHIAGDFQDARYELYFNQMMREMALEEMIRIDGWVRDVPPWLEDKQYIVCTSVLEGHPVGIMEAMACGLKPVIHNYVGARGRYPDEFLWNTIPDFVRMVREDAYDSGSYRRFVSEKYSLNAQLRQLDDIVTSLKG